MNFGRRALTALLGTALLAAPAVSDGGGDILQLKDGRVVDGVALKIDGKDAVVATYPHGEVRIPIALVADYVIGGAAPEATTDDAKAQRANGLVPYKDKWVKPEVRDKLLKKDVEDKRKTIEETKAHAEWRNRWKFEGKYFSFESTLSQEQNDHYAGVLDAYFEVFKRDWSISIPKEFPKRLKVCIYPTRDEFEKGAGAPRGVLAYYKWLPAPERDLNFYNDRNDARLSETVMFHECNHYLVDLFSQGLRYPHWIGESLAEYYGGSIFDPRTRTVKVGQIQEGRLAEVREDIVQNKRYPLLELINPKEARAYEDYYWGWSFVHFMMETPAYQKKFKQFFVELSHGSDVRRKPFLSSGGLNFTSIDNDEVLRVFKKRMGLADATAFDALEKEWYAYIDKLQPTELRGYEQAGLQAFGNDRILFEAPRLLKLAIDKGSRSPKVFVAYSQCLRAKGPEKLEEALDVMKKAETIDPLNADCWAERGFVLQLMGQKAEGKKLVDLAYDLDPTGYFVDYQTLLSQAGVGK